jgi:hypothetical protein|tara:strand:+ start:271 stop:474 length:204 start_codon:yes stop_codon:yes gene_type:complete
MTLAETRERVHQEIEALQDEKSTLGLQIEVHNKELILLMDRVNGVAEQIEKLSNVIPVLKQLEEAER